jgi:CHAD domain-containing protein
VDASLSTRPVMTVEQAADVAVATVLLTFFDGVEVNLTGALADIDPECLHDLRVGVRRTRSLLKRTGDVLPHGLAQRFAARFKWVGSLTTPVRDLDVNLLAFDQLAADLPAARRHDLEPYREHLRRQRSMHFETLTRGLSDGRFKTMRERWRQELTAVAEFGYSPAPTAGELAADRIGRARKAVRRRAEVVTSASPAEALHDLRKRAKELRYLLETFAPLYGRRAGKAVKDLKRVQDVLGAYQDAQVQLSAVREYAGGLTAAPAAVDDLAAVLEHRLQQARTDVVPRLSAFLSR